MFDAVWQLLPVVLGVMASPLAVLGLIGILLSRHARSNGVAYLVGWVASTAVLLTVSILIIAASGGAATYGEARWVAVVHLLVGVVCIAGAMWTYRRARRVLARMAAARTPDELAAAAPQLPGLVRSVARYTPGRSFILGMGIFLNPMNVSLVAAAGLAITHGAFAPVTRTLLSIGFVCAAALPVAIPVLIVLVRRERAEPMLRGLRRWMLKHNGYLSAGILLLVGVLQLIKALQVWD